MGQRWMLLGRFQTLGEAELLVAALAKEGVGADLRGRHAVAIEPEPVEVWVQERNATRANAVLVGTQESVGESESICARCGEPSPASFERCWKCEAVLPR